jgi:hypothetical protein
MATCKVGRNAIVYLLFTPTNNKIKMEGYDLYTLQNYLTMRSSCETISINMQDIVEELCTQAWWP